MDSGLDPFADLVPEKALNHVRVAGKFQPRGKLRPGKATSTSLPSNVKEKSRSSLQTPLGMTVDTVDDRLKSTAGFSVASSTLIEKEEILGNNRENTKREPVNSSTQVVARIEDPDSSDALSLKVNEDSGLLVTADSLQPDLHSLDVHVPNSTAIEDNRSKESTSLSLATSSVANEPRNDNHGLCLDELDSIDAMNWENGASDVNSGWSSRFMKSTEDVGSLGLELDPIGDALFLPAVDNARVGGKFKPKAKVQPRKGASEAIVMPISSGRIATIVSANLSAEFVEVGGGELTNSVDSSLTTTENLVTGEPLRNDDYTNSGVISSDTHSGFEKPIGENADIFLGLEYIHDFVTQRPNNIEIPLPTSNDEETEQQCRFPTQNSGNSSILRACNTAVLDSVTCNESVVQADDGGLQSEESGPFFNVERPDFLPDSTNVFESCSRKLQPKPKVLNGKEKPTVTDVPQGAVGSVAPPTETQFITSETAYGNEGLIPTFPSDEVLDYSSMSFSNFISPDATTPELPMNEEHINVAEASQSSDANILYQEDGYGVPVNESSKSKKQKPSAVSHPPHKSKQFSLAGDGKEGDKSTRRPRKRTAGPQFVEEPEDETHNNGSFPSETPSTSIADDDNDYDYRVDEDDDEDRSKVTSQKKKATKKSQKPAVKNQNPGRRRKRDNDAQEHSTQVPQKKFSHSTRRKNRLKDLLSIPEDEVDFQRLPFKDIILLAGYKESLAVKEAKASKNASTDQRSNNSAHGEESLNEEDAVASEQDGGYAEDQSNKLFNHNSFMDKTPKSRWSKQDTELFYEGIRQFGTDLSMIQQLFPGKTRHQMKLKYKKEERQHPLLLSEALGSRAKDNSYFEKVIEQLQLVFTSGENESNKDGSAGASDEEAELNHETHEDTAKTERGDEDIIDEDNVGNGGGIDCPKYDGDEDEDDMDIWNSYQSVY
ncbi:uncharacterized protein [Euphorbia lathyris]|uniref:uncharacterized protein isoform X2 n=1 Tax=Euphorbia lathyris TaxID=212925 RepID=UPI0033135D11